MSAGGGEVLVLGLLMDYRSNLEKLLRPAGQVGARERARVRARRRRARACARAESVWERTGRCGRSGGGLARGLGAGPRAYTCGRE